MIRASFFMEQHVGHRTFYRNLREFIDLDSRIQANWVQVTYTDSNSSWEKIPYISEKVRGTLIGRQQVRRGWEEYESDVAFFSTQVPAVLGGSVLKHLPYVLCTDITPIQYDKMGEYYHHQPDTNGLVGTIKHRTNSKVFNNAACILPWTNWVSQSLVSDYSVPPSNVTVVPVGVDLRLWKPKETQSTGSVRFLFVGGDFYRKGGDLLLEAFRRLPNRVAELILVTEEVVPPEKNIRVYNDLQPNSPELIALFQESDVFVLPTRAEAYGIVAIEAGASGLPVIMADVGGARDIVQNNKNGYLIEKENIQQLFDRMIWMIENPKLRWEMGQEARNRVKECFDAKKNATQIVDILLKVATEQRAR